MNSNKAIEKPHKSFEVSSKEQRQRISGFTFVHNSLSFIVLWSAKLNLLLVDSKWFDFMKCPPS